MSLLSQTGQHVMVLEEGPFQAASQIHESAIVQAYGDGPYLSLGQVAETAIISEEASLRLYIGGVHELTLVVQESAGSITPFLGQVAQEVLLLTSDPLPEPSFVNQLVQLHLVADIPPPVNVSGVQSTALILEENALPVPALMKSVFNITLLEEPQRLGIVQQYESALIEVQPPLLGLALVQGVQATLLSEEAAADGTLSTQVVEAALILTEQPANDSRIIQGYQLALHVDVSGVTTLSNTVSVQQVTLIQVENGEPTLNPTRTRFISLATALDSVEKYPAHVQSTSSVSSVLAQVVLGKTMPAQMQSISKLSGVVGVVAKRSTSFIDPSQIGSFVQSRGVISYIAQQSSKQQPSTIHSMSVLRGIAHSVARPVTKIDPETISSTEQIPSVVMQTTMVKQYGPASIISSAQQMKGAMPTAMHKQYADGETIESNSIMKKIARLVARPRAAQPLDTIRSQTKAQTTSTSVSKSATFMNPDDIRPILSLSGVSELMARTIVMPLPSAVFAPAAQYTTAQLVVAGRMFIPPDEILGSTLFQYATVELVAKSTFYSPPEQVEVARREVYGTYYSELDNT